MNGIDFFVRENNPCLGQIFAHQKYFTIIILIILPEMDRLNLIIYSYLPTSITMNVTFLVGRVDLEILKENSSGGGTGSVMGGSESGGEQESGGATLLQVKQLEQQNQRLHDTLVK